jgi:protein O-mannosyl-transferase
MLMSEAESQNKSLLDQVRLSQSTGLCLIVALVVSCLFASGLSAPFTFDDQSNISRNPEIRQLWPLTPLLNESRMVGYYSFALNYACGAREAYMYRATNIVIHAIAACLLFGITRFSLMRLNYMPERATWLAFGIAILWGVHPLQTGAVTYVVQRLESLMGMFVFLAFLLLIVGAEKKRRWCWYLGSIVACWLGLFTKEVAATLIPVALLYDRAILTDSWVNVLRKRGWVYCCYAIGFLLLVWVSMQTYGSEGNTSAGFNSQKITPWMYLRSQPEIILYYVKMVFIPWPQSIDYGWVVATTPLKIYGNGAIILGILGAACFLWRNHALWSWLILSFFFMLAPTSSFIPILDLAFEHRMYLPLACVVSGCVILIEQLLQRLYRSAKNVQWIGAVLLLIGTSYFALFTYWRNGEYVNDIALWQSAAQLNPQHLRTWNNLGAAYRKVLNYSAAVDCFEKVLQAKPHDKFALNALAGTLAYLGESEKNSQYLQRAEDLARLLVEKHPKVTGHYLTLALTLEKQGKWNAAMQLCREVLEKLNSQDAIQLQKKSRWDINDAESSPQAEVHVRMAALLFQQKEWEKSLAELQAAETWAPTDSAIFFQQGVTLAEMGKTNEAIAMYRKTLQYDSRSTAAMNNLGMLLASQGKRTEAIKWYQKAVSLNANYSEAYDNYGNLLSRAKHYAEAIPLYEKALAANAQYLPAKLHLGRAHMRLGDFASAIVILQFALAQDKDNLEAQAMLAWVYATSMNADEVNRQLAVTYAVAAMNDQPQNAERLDILAAAYAAVGEFEQAIACEERAIGLVKTDSPNLSPYKIRLALYRSHQPYRE